MSVRDQTSGTWQKKKIKYDCAKDELALAAVNWDPVKRPQPVFTPGIWEKEELEELSRYVDWHRQHPHCNTPRPIKEDEEFVNADKKIDEGNDKLVYTKMTGQIPPIPQQYEPTVLGRGCNISEVSVASWEKEYESILLNRWDNEDPWYTMSVKDHLESSHIDGSHTTVKRKEKNEEAKHDSFRKEYAWKAEQYGDYAGGAPPIHDEALKVMADLALADKSSVDIDMSKPKVSPWAQERTFTKFTATGTALLEYQKIALQRNIDAAVAKHKDDLKQEEKRLRKARRSMSTKSGRKMSPKRKDRPRSTSTTGTAVGAATGGGMADTTLELGHAMMTNQSGSGTGYEGDADGAAAVVPPLALVDSTLTSTTNVAEAGVGITNKSSNNDNNNNNNNDIINNMNNNKPLSAGAGAAAILAMFASRTTPAAAPAISTSTTDRDASTADTNATSNTAQSRNKHHHHRHKKHSKVVPFGESNEDADGFVDTRDKYEIMREKLGDEKDIERMNRKFLRLAKTVAKKSKIQKAAVDVKMDLVEACTKLRVVKVNAMLIMPGARPNMKTPEDEPILLHMVARALRMDSISHNLRLDDHQRETSDRKKITRIIAALIYFGADLDIFGREGLTCAHMAAINDNSKLVDLFYERGADFAKLSRNEDMTPLMAAAKFGHVYVCADILKHEIPVDAMNPSLGWTALHFAAAYGQTRTAMFLLRVGAHKLKQTFAGETAAKLAADRGFQSTAQAVAAYSTRMRPVKMQLEYLVEQNEKFEASRALSRMKPVDRGVEAFKSVYTLLRTYASNLYGRTKRSVQEKMRLAKEVVFDTLGLEIDEMVGDESEDEEEEDSEEDEGEGEGDADSDDGRGKGVAVGIDNSYSEAKEGADNSFGDINEFSVAVVNPAGADDVQPF